MFVTVSIVALAGFAAVYRGNVVAKPAAPTKERVMPTKKYTKPPAAELKSKLTPEQYEVTQESGTEPPFRNAYWDNHEPGLYVDVVVGRAAVQLDRQVRLRHGLAELHAAASSRAGVAREDRQQLRHGADRGALAGRRLAPGARVRRRAGARRGLRYCINSASLRFVPADKLEAEGYGEYRALFRAAGAAAANGTPRGASVTRETAILAGGCFWGMEEILRKIPGVLETEVGYTGGTIAEPDLRGRARRDAPATPSRCGSCSTRSKLSYEDLLEK